MNKYLDFHDRDTYLAQARQWSADHKSLMQKIREMKLAVRKNNSVFDKEIRQEKTPAFRQLCYSLIDLASLREEIKKLEYQRAVMRETANTQVLTRKAQLNQQSSSV